MYFRFIEEGTETLVYSAVVHKSKDYTDAIIEVTKMGYSIIGRSDDSTENIIKFIVRKKEE